MNKVKLIEPRKCTLIVYILQVLSLLTGITAIVGLIINYIKLEDMRGTIYESHFKWQIETFWIWFIALIISIPLCIILVGYFLLLANYIYYLYRLIKGLIYFAENKPLKTVFYKVVQAK